MVLPRSTFQACTTHSNAPLPLQPSNQTSNVTCNDTSISHYNTATKVAPLPDSQQHKSCPPHNNNNNNNNNNTNKTQPTSALDLLKHHRQQQQDSSRLCLLLPTSTPSNSNNTSTTPSNNTLFPLSCGITEIFGSAGSGKTQIGLAVCVSSVLSSSKNKALYVSLGEGTFSQRMAQRLSQMAAARISQQQQCTVDSMLQRIHTRSMRNQDEFLHFIREELSGILSQGNVKVVVLDSIAGMFRSSTENSYTSRSSLLFQISANLKRLSEMYQVPILVMNQVTTNLSDNGAVVPALGISWAQCVNTSYRVERSETTGSSTTEQEQQGGGVFTRRITLVRSSSHAPVSYKFRIDASGVVALPP